MVTETRYRGRRTNKSVGDILAERFAEFSGRKTLELERWAKAKWLELARAELSGTAYERYAAGMRIPRAASGRFELDLALQGFEARQLEFGWAPPQGKGDGIGEWDGSPKDMRPMMGLKDAETIKADAKDLKKKNVGGHYKVVRFEEMKSTETLIRETQAHVNLRSTIQRAAAKGFGKALKSLEAGHSLPPSATKDIPPMRPSWTSNAAQHYGWIYGRARKNFETKDAGLKKNQKYTSEDRAGIKPGRRKPFGRKGQFTVFRTITDSVDQVNRHLWFSPGVKPVNLREKLQVAINEAIHNMVAGLNPDGSERGAT